MGAVVQNRRVTHRITVEEYYRMAEVGLLAPDARVELIEGQIIDMVPMGSGHARAVSLLMQRLVRAAGDRAIVRVQLPIRLSLYSEPLPDLALVRARLDHYGSAHPSGSDTVLVIEVSETTLRTDLEVKIPLYARSGVPEVWLVDLKNRQFRFYRRPADGQYTQVSTMDAPGLMSVACMEDVVVDLSDVLGTSLV